METNPKNKSKVLLKKEDICYKIYMYYIEILHCCSEKEKHIKGWQLHAFSP